MDAPGDDRQVEEHPVDVSWTPPRQLSEGVVHVEDRARRAGGQQRQAEGVGGTAGTGAVAQVLHAPQEGVGVDGVHHDADMAAPRHQILARHFASARLGLEAVDDCLGAGEVGAQGGGKRLRRGLAGAIEGGDVAPQDAAGAIAQVGRGVVVRGDHCDRVARQLAAQAAERLDSGLERRGREEDRRGEAQGQARPIVLDKARDRQHERGGEQEGDRQ